MADNEVYKTRLSEASAIVDAHFADKAVIEKHRSAERAIVHADLWASVLTARPEAAVLNAAVDELDSGFYNVVTGQYREAYGNLRLSLELGMAAVHFSVDELARRNWLRDKGDIIWSKLIKDDDREKPVFTTEFVAVFNEDMGGRWTQYRTIANALHRELSTYVHGAASKRKSSRKLAFRSELAIDWFEKVENAHLAWQYLMLARYTDYLKSVRPTLSNPFLDMLKREFNGIEDVSATLAEFGVR